MGKFCIARGRLVNKGSGVLQMSGANWYASSVRDQLNERTLTYLRDLRQDYFFDKTLFTLGNSGFRQIKGTECALSHKRLKRSRLEQKE